MGCDILRVYNSIPNHLSLGAFYHVWVQFWYTGFNFPPSGILILIINGVGAFELS
jgi:hypothetical protein